MWLYIPSHCLPEERDSTLDLSSLAQRLEQSVMSRSEFKTQKFWLQGLKKGRWMKRLSGLTCEPSTAQLGAEKWIASLAGFRDKTSALPEKVKGLSKATDRAFGSSMPASFARYDPASSSWKTSALSLFEESTEFLETWPTSGTTQNGAVFQRRNVVLHSSGSEYSSWPTPDCSMTNGIRQEDGKRNTGLNTHAETWPTLTANDDNKSPEAYRHMREHKLGRKGKAAETISSLQVKVQVWKTPHGLGGRDSTGKAGGAGGGEFAKQANQWATPNARDDKNPGSPDGPRAQRKAELGYTVDLNDQAAMWGTPRAEEWKGTGPEGSKSHQHRLDRGYLDAQAESFHPDQLPSTSGTMSSEDTLGSPLPSLRKKLNPIFVSWLMGWPLWWCSKEPMPYGCSAMELWWSRQQMHLRYLLEGQA